MKAPLPEKHGRHWCIRVRMPNGERAWVPVAKSTATLARATDRAAEWNEHRAERIVAWMKAREEQKRAEAAQAADGPTMTVSALAEAWIDGRLLEQHGPQNRLRERRDVVSARSVLRRCAAVRTRGEHGPTLGELAVKEVTERDIEIAMRRGPKANPSARTVTSYYSILHRLFDLAERPCRLRDRGTNPCDKSMRPAPDDEKIYSFLLPHEVLAVLAFEGAVRGKRKAFQLREADVLRWKVLLILGVYLGLRKENLRGLRWADVDLDSGSFVALRTKNGLPIFATLHFDGVADVLRRWREHTPTLDTDPIVRISERQSRRARQVLHILLRAAGVTRSILFDSDPRVEPIRFHDLRSTFVTWARRAGHSEDFIRARTGHVTKAMIERYSKLATSVEAATFVPFPDLTNAIPEFDHLAPELAPDACGGDGEEQEPRAEALGTLVRSSVFKTVDRRREESLVAEIALLNAGVRPSEAPTDDVSSVPWAPELAPAIRELRGLARCGSLPELDALELLEAAVGDAIAHPQGRRS